MNKKLATKIDKFLKDKRKSERMLAQVTKADVDLLEDIIHDLITSKCEADSDGAFPIEVTLVNRLVHQRLHYVPVPYQHKDPQGCASAQLHNLKISSKDLFGVEKIVDPRKY